MLGPHSGMIRCAIRVDAECRQPRFFWGRDALLFRLWQGDFGLRHNGRRRCWATNRDWVHRSQRFLGNPFMLHGGCSSGGSSSTPTRRASLTRAAPSRVAAACWGWWSPSACRSGARGSRVWSRPTDRPAGRVRKTFARPASRSRPACSLASTIASICAMKARNTS